MNKSATIRDNMAMRWIALVLLSSLTFATYWFLDFFGGIKEVVIQNYGFSNENFGRILGMTNLANMFGMIMLGGFILDKWGIRITGFIFGSLAAIGAGIVYLGSIGFFGDEVNTKLWSMIGGRIIFGSGLEVISVIATRGVVKWFKGYELALAMAFNVGFGRLGTAMSIAVSGDIANGTASTAIGFAASIVALSLLLFATYSIFDSKLDRQARGQLEDNEEFKLSDVTNLIKNKAFIFITLLCVTFYAAVSPFLQYASDLMVNKFGFSSTLPQEANFVVNGSISLGNSLVYIVLFIFALCFSLIPNIIASKKGKIFSRLGIIALLVMLVYPFRDIIGMWLGNGPKTASLIPLGTIIFTPIFGNIVDKKGKAASLMILGSSLLIFAHVSLSVFSSVYLCYLGLFSLGIAFSLVPAAMWPSIPKIVPENILGTAYAFIFTIQNWGLTLFYWGIGALLDYSNKGNMDKIARGEATYDYTFPMMFLIGCGVISIILAYNLKKADKKYGFGLE